MQNKSEAIEVRDMIRNYLKNNSTTKFYVEIEEMLQGNYKVEII